MYLFIKRGLVLYAFGQFMKYMCMGNPNVDS